MRDLSGNLHLLFVVLAIVFAVLATFNVPVRWINAFAASFLLFLLSLLV